MWCMKTAIQDACREVQVYYHHCFPATCPHCARTACLPLFIIPMMPTLYHPMTFSPVALSLLLSSGEVIPTFWSHWPLLAPTSMAVAWLFLFCPTPLAISPPSVSIRQEGGPCRVPEFSGAYCLEVSTLQPSQCFRFASVLPKRFSG